MGDIDIWYYIYPEGSALVVVAETVKCAFREKGMCKIRGNENKLDENAEQLMYVWCAKVGQPVGVR